MKKLFRLKFIFPLFLFFCTFLLTIHGAESSSDKSPYWTFKTAGNQLAVTLQLPENLKMNADMTYPELSSATDSLTQPESRSMTDEIIGISLPVYPGPGKYTWTYDADQLKFPLTITLHSQACSDDGICAVPEKKQLVLNTLQDFSVHSPLPAGSKQEYTAPPVPTDLPDLSRKETGNDPYYLLPDFEILRSTTGYQSPGEFLKFLQSSPGQQNNRGNLFSGYSFWWMLILAMIGGLALNLTPCILPLIPVNLAMICAAEKQEEISRKTRILRGVFYGAGIAVSYGLLGIFCVVTGATFGSVDASPLFNLAVAVLFLLLALSMFGLFNLDFSRYSSRIKIPSGAKYGGIFLMGAVTSLLAGACVAPVLVAVLIQAAAMFRQGDHTGFLLPFFLGIGMALPWPFLAAGMAVLPKPGKWMVKIKYALGVLILILAFYYAYTGSTLLFPGEVPQTAAEENLEQLNRALLESRASGKPVLIDFWASWCKNCTAMEHHTFNNSRVKQELADHYILLRIQAEDPEERLTSVLLEQFQVVGLPTFVVIQAK